MKSYKLKVSLEKDNKTYLLIEFAPDFSLEDLHYAILDAIGFDNIHPASFYVCDENWATGIEIKLEDMGDLEEETEEAGIDLLMRDYKLRDVLKKKGDRLVYIYDFLNMWTFRIELMTVNQKSEHAAGDLPLLIDAKGEMPDQYEDSDAAIDKELSSEDEKILKSLKKDNSTNLKREEEDDFYDDDYGDDEDERDYY